MELTTIRELYKNRDSYMDQKVTIGGWVRSIRGSKAFGFIVVNDGTFFEHVHLRAYAYVCQFLLSFPASPSCCISSDLLYLLFLFVI